MIPSRMRLIPITNYDVMVHCDSVDCMFNMLKSAPENAEDVGAACDLKHIIIRGGKCIRYMPVDCQGNPKQVNTDD
jgi:hypothetical protein